MAFLHARRSMMGRKNHRVDTFVPLDLTPSEIPKPPKYPTPASRDMVAATRRRREEERWARAERQQAAREDWTVCVVPGCGAELVHWGYLEHECTDRRDPTKELPICYRHAAVVWLQLAAFQTRNGKFLEQVADVRDATRLREDQERRYAQAVHMADTANGDIYFVRLNGLVKVGWTRDIHQRLRSYGASAELLVNYPASRDDETHLHRQLRPALAKGREWYEDGPIIADFISKALEKYGTPLVEVKWTQPKRIVAGKRHR